MVPSLPVVQGIEAEPEPLEEVDPILGLHHVILVRLHEKRIKKHTSSHCQWNHVVKLKCKSQSLLHCSALYLNVGAWGEPKRCFPSTMRLGLSHMLLLQEDKIGKWRKYFCIHYWWGENLEEKLSVQVGDVNGVQVNDLNVREAWGQVGFIDLLMEAEAGPLFFKSYWPYV